jgi:hypothetical protein
MQIPTALVVAALMLAPAAPVKAQQAVAPETIANAHKGIAVSDPYKADDGSLSLTIRNTNDFTVKDVTVECVFQAASRTELGRSSATVYQIFRPQDPDRRVPDLNFGRIPPQAATAGCHATRAIPVP